MEFIQIVEYNTSRADEMQKLAQEYQARRAAADEGPRPLQVTVTKDRDRDNVYLSIIRFASQEEAMQNSRREDTSELARGFAALCDGPATFRNLDVVMEQA